MTGIYYPQARVNIAFIPFDEIVNDDNLIRLSGVAPKMMRVESNDIYSADKFSFDVDESVFRLDPRDVRCLAVDLHAADTGGFDVPLRAIDDSSRLLLGHTDKITQKYNTNAASLLTCEGRDYAGLLLDEKWQGRRLELGRPLTELIREAIDVQPATATLDIVLADGVIDPVVPAGTRKKDRYYQAQPDTTLWEALIALAMRVGVMITVQLDAIVIQPPRNILGQGREPLAPMFIEGQNVKSLKITRELGVADLPNIQVTALHPGTAQLVTGTYPDIKRRTSRAPKKKGRTRKKERVEIKRFTIRHPDPTEARLAEVARGIFEYYAQQQISVSLTTMDMQIVTEPDASALERARGRALGQTVPATSVRNGMPVRIRIDQNARTLLTRAITPAQKQRELEARGYQRQVAKVLARGWRAVDQTLFVSTAVHNYDSEGGYSLDVEAMNYITVDAPK